MSSNHPTKPATHVLSVAEQDANIIRDAIDSLADLNGAHRGTRRITSGMAKKVATRSLIKSADESYSVRRHRAFSELSEFAALVQQDKVITAAAHTDLLSLAHPRSTRKTSMDWKELRKAQARWFADDSRVTDPLVGPLLASAFASEPGSPAQQYAVARLNAMGPGKVPLIALVAAFKMGGNKGFWRFQLRDSEGKFSNMGGGLRRLVRRIGGGVSWLAGRIVSTNPSNKTFIQELPDGRLIRTPASAGKSVKAILPSQQDAQGFSKTPAKSSADSDVIDEADLEFVDSPDGYAKDPSFKPTQDDLDYYGPNIDLGTRFVDDNDNYEIVKFDNGNNVAAMHKFEAQQQKEAEGNNVVALGMGENGELDPTLPVYFVRRKDGKEKEFATVQSWGDVQSFISKDEDLYEAGDPADPQRPERAAGLLDPELQIGDKVDIADFDGQEIPGDANASKVKQTAYRRKLKKFKEEGGEFPLDPTRDHFMMDDGTVIDSETGRVLRDSLGNANPNAWLDDFDEQGTQNQEESPADETEASPETGTTPENFYSWNTDAPYEPQGAVDNQISEDYTDDPSQLSEEYSTKDLATALNEGVAGTEEQSGTGFGYLPFSDGTEPVPVEAIYEALNEKGEDAKAILDDIYKGGTGDLGTKVPKATEESLGEEIPDAAKATPSNKTLPPIIEGMTEDEQKAFLDSGDYKSYLPKNKVYEESEVPEGYSSIDDAPFNEIEGDTPQDAPEGFSVNPVDIANDYKNDELVTELRRALEPGTATPGYGILGMDTPEGEQYLANVPAEAIRDALQLQGVDTDELIDNIYQEGLKGQSSDEPTPEEVQDALEGENVQEDESPEDAPEVQEPSTEAPQPPTEDSQDQAADTTDDGGAGTVTPGISTGEPDGPALLSASAENLKAGDITFSDNFVIENVFSDADSEAQKPGSVWIEGYYPGHQTQKTKLWNKNVQIKVYRNVEVPAKGDLPTLSKPKPKEFDPEGKIFNDTNLGAFVPKDAEARSKFLDALDEYNKNLAQAQGLWTAPDTETLAVWQTEEVASPFSPANPVGVTTVKATEVKAGDVTFKKEWGSDFYEYFIIEGVEEVDGKAVVQGYYPGHVSQTKEWNATTEITVMRGASDLPAPGNAPALERPKKDDPDLVEKKAAFKAAKKLSAEGFTPPIDPDSVSTAQTGDTDKPKKKTPSKPKAPASPAFSGEKLKQIEVEAAGDPIKFLELLEKEEIIYLDFETAADGAFDSQTPIQVAWTKINDGLATAAGAYWMNPEVPLGDFYKKADPDKTLKDPSGNPVSDEFLAKQPSLEEQMTKLLEKIGPDTIVLAHNLPFDGGIMKRFAQKFGLNYSPSGEVDTLSLARLVINGGNGAHTLQSVANRYGIVPDGDWHDAVTDSDVLPSILKNLMQEMAKTNQGISALDVDANMQKYEEELAEFKAAQGKKDLADTSLAVSKVIQDAFDGDNKFATVDEIVKSMPKVRPTSDEATSATAAPKSDLADGDLAIESVLGDSISNNWVEDNENTTSLGKVAIEEWQVGDFVSAPSEGWFEVLEILDDPADPNKVFVRRRLLANGKEYGMNKSWVKFQAYGIRRRNGEVEAPVLEEAASNVDTEATIEKWQTYDIKQDADGVYYADGISSSDVQKLRSGVMTPPQLPFFAPIGGGNKPDQGDGYFFATNGMRFWGKFGAAGALVRRKNNEGVFEYFLAKRSSGLSQGGGKWGYPGGAHKDKSDSEENNGIITAINEFEEEVGGDLGPDSVPGWTYNTHVFEVGPGQLNDLSPKDGESSEVGWFTADQISKMASQGTLQDNFADTADVLLGLALDEPTTAEPDEIVIPEAQSGSLGQVFDTSNWKKVSGQAGSNQGAFYVDPGSGQQYYVKTPKTEAHAANEVLASALYEEAGLAVGRAYIGKNKAGKIVIVSPVIDNVDGELNKFPNNPEILNQIQNGFAVDAWLNNYDVIGLEKDNILVNKDGKAFRIDAGGALLFRAQGADKSEQMNENVSEQIASLQNPDVNAQSASVFGQMGPAEIGESAKLVANIDEAKIDELVDEAFAGGIDGISSQSIANSLKENLKRRRKELIEIYGLDDEPIEAPIASEYGPDKVLLSLDDIDPKDLIDDLDAQIQDAIATGNNIVFKYNGKTVDLSPAEVKTAKNGNVNVVGTLPNGKFYTYNLTKMEQENDAAPQASEPSVATPQPSDEITLDPQAEPVESVKPTEVPQDQKQKLVQKVENIAEALFGSKDPEKIKQLLQGFKDNEVEDPELVESILNDLTNPAPAATPKVTPEEKITDDLEQALTPVDGDEDIPTDAVSKIDLDELAKELANPTDPDLIWAQVIEDYSASTLDNGHIVVSSTKFNNKRFDVLVKRNSDNTFSTYHRITDEETGVTRVKELKGRWHSSTALNSRINNEIYKSKAFPAKILAGSKKETASTIQPSMPPKQQESYVSADGTTVIQVGMTVTDTKTGKKGVVTSLKDQYVVKAGGKTYTYTDVAKVKFEGQSKANWKASTFLMPEGSQAPEDGPDQDPGQEGDGGGGAPTPPTTPETPAPEAPTPEPEELQPAEAVAPSGLTPESTLAEVESVAVDKNSAMHTSYFGASNKNEYKSLVKKYLVKDATSTGQNMLPGIIASNQDPDAPNPELASHGVVTKTFPNELAVEVTYFDGPMKGTTQKLEQKNVWSREKFLTNEQSKELGIEVDDSIRAEAIKAQGAKAEEAKKQAVAQAEQEKKQKEESAKKAVIEKAKQDLADKFTVEGPGFSVETLDGPANWGDTPLEQVPSLQSAVTKLDAGSPLEAANGSQIMIDAGDIEDLKVRIQKVEKDGKKQIRLSFKLTNWAGNAFTKKLAKQQALDVSDNARLDKYKTNADGSLTFSEEWSTGNVDGNNKGRTYRGEIAGGSGAFQFIRANRSATTPDFFKKGGSSNGPVSLHNRVEILLPENATPEQIAEAIKEVGGVQEVRPATEADFRGIAENKIISLFGKKGNGAKNYEGELRKQILDEVEKNYNFTADNMEVRVDEQQKGAIQYLLPEEVAEQLAATYGVSFFKHNFASGNLPSDEKARADFVYDLLFKTGGGLYSTVTRWTEGLNTSGQSSSSDLAGVGAGYVFTRKTPKMDLNQGSYKGLEFFFDGVQLIRRPEFYGSNYDEWGKKYEDTDYLELLKGANVSEVLFKDNLSWADLSGISLDSAARKFLLERLTSEGITEIAGKPVNELFGVK